VPKLEYPISLILFQYSNTIVENIILSICPEA